MSENTAYEQKDLDMVVSEPIHNPYNEMVLIAKEYSAAYRALCRLRIEIASLYEEKAWSKVDWVPHEKCKKNAEFWARSGAYWKKKLEESLRREKDYLDGQVMDPFMMGDSTQSVKGPLNEIHARLAVKDIHDKMEKAIGNITASCVARTSPIKSKTDC